ncbi:MAG: DinB family protein [Proteobacteria bacterium]|nr:DinB family protein [Pseudomonadota bacterium]
MTIASKLALIEEFHRLSNAFDDTLNLEREAVLFRPFWDSWSIIEQVVHCVDFDIANFHRYRWGIVSPGTTVLSFDGTWTSGLDYQASELSAAINAIKAVRHLMSSHLKRIVDSDWSKYCYTFDDGNGFTLEEALQHFIGHVGFHRELIDRNIKLFAQT